MLEGAGAASRRVLGVRPMFEARLVVAEAEVAAGAFFGRLQAGLRTDELATLYERPAADATQGAMGRRPRARRRTTRPSTRWAARGRGPAGGGP